MSQRIPRAEGPDFVGVGVAKCATTWLGDVLDQHPEVDIILLTEPPFGLEPAVLLRTLREKFPLLTTIAWGGAEEDFTGAGGEKPDICIKGPPDIRKIKVVLDGITRQRF